MKIFRKFTLKSLTKNKTRTLVTIIGILLSAAMFSAVTTFVVSLQQYMLDTIIEDEGDWVGKVCRLEEETLKDLKRNPQVSCVMDLQNIGYSHLENSANQDKPYLFVAGCSQQFADHMPIHLLSGRMPEDSSEIILPEHLSSNARISHKIGDVLELQLGYRSSGGQTLGQSTMFQGEAYAQANETEPEIFTSTEIRTYTVVGFYSRPSFESYTAPGYTALTVQDRTKTEEAAEYDAYFTMEAPKKVYQLLEENFSEYETDVHHDLLRYSGNSNESSLNRTLYSMAAVLIGIIVFASISLIYNAFSISVSERTKQFGLLSSIGATKKQLMGTVIFESLILSIVGIPLGLLSGFAGIAVTLKLTEKLFFTGLGFSSEGGITFHAVMTWEAMFIAAAICLLTVMISAYIPARRATKQSAIEAIRQSGDIKIKPGKVKTSKITYKLFGLEGMIASKNFKRNKKKYRSTVVSLFVSVVLFISASSFCAYMTKGVTGVATERNFDISYNIAPDSMSTEETHMLYQEFSQIDTVTGQTLMYTDSGKITVDKNNVNTASDFTAAFPEVTFDEENATLENILLFFLDDVSYEKYLKENKYDVQRYMDAENPTALVLGYMKKYTGSQYQLYNVFTKENFKSSWTPYSAEEEDVPPLTEFNVGEITQHIPLGLSNNYGYNIMFLFPQSAMKYFNLDSPSRIGFMYFSSSDHIDTQEKMAKILASRNFSTSRLRDYASYEDNDRNMILLVRIFSTGFIVLISLIAAANVFNTISTNINLRRREFAMLKSMGMTGKGFNKMMNYECLLYGIKGLLYGIPVAIGITYFIYRSMTNGIDMDFFIPLDSLIIAIASVFLVVFATMLYSMRKVKKENTVDALKTEVF